MTDEIKQNDLEDLGKPAAGWKTGMVKFNGAMGYIFSTSAVIAGVWGLAKGAKAPLLDGFSDPAARIISGIVTAIGLTVFPFAKAQFDTAKAADGARNYRQLQEALKTREEVRGH